MKTRLALAAIVAVALVTGFAAAQSAKRSTAS